LNTPVTVDTASRWFSFDNSYARELEGFYVPCSPSAVPAPRLIKLNRALAEELGTDPDALATTSGIEMLAGNAVPDGATPLAQAYAGHQFGHFSSQLGDGRALLLGEVIDRHGQRRDIALKGSGRTAFSRRGDGKCALGPALREYLVGESMSALGIPTTRTLAVVTTGEMVFRDRPLPGAVLTRVAASHLRIGTFEFFAAHRGLDAVRQLADYAIARHYPDIAHQARPYLALLDAVATRQANLVARWMGIGFIHGVMNTDNMTISGETIDYGPCAFMESYDPNTVFSSIDTNGRYAYGQQASIARWNLSRFADALLPLFDTDETRAISAATDILDAFPSRHADVWLDVMRAKLGLDDAPGAAAEDRVLAEDFLNLLRVGRIDFTKGFRALYATAEGSERAFDLFAEFPDFAAWRLRWHARQSMRSAERLTSMKCASPCYIPRNHLVEGALNAAIDDGNLAPFDRLLTVLEQPFDQRSEDAVYAEPAPSDVTASYQTFCGT